MKISKSLLVAMTVAITELTFTSCTKEAEEDNSKVQQRESNSPNNVANEHPGETYEDCIACGMG